MPLQFFLGLYDIQRPHLRFSHLFSCGLFFPVVAVVRLLWLLGQELVPTAFRPKPRALCHTEKSLRLVTKSVRNVAWLEKLFWSEYQV